MLVSNRGSSSESQVAHRSFRRSRHRFQCPVLVLSPPVDSLGTNGVETAVGSSGRQD
jgi:hypothetical protein